MLSAKKLLSKARKIAGLDDYGDMAFDEGLNVLIKSINDEAELTSGNELRVERELLRVLINRLRMEQDIATHREILEEEISPPVFITSIPRTGSTKLHRLMAATGDFHALKFWHTYNFAPFPDSFSSSPDPRIADAELYLEWRNTRSPKFQQSHPVYAEEAEEELALLEAGFNSLYQYAAMLNVPSYVHWVLARDGLLAFRDLRRMLQYLQWQHHRGSKRRWVLKTPSFFGLEASFAQVFPGTDFIVTHRHPLLTMASTCTTFCGIRKLYSDMDYTAVAGASMLYNFGESLKGHLRWRDAYPADKILDVRFEAVTHDETALLERIYRFLRMPVTDIAKANVQAWIAMDAQRGHLRSSATLADYGVTPEQIDRYLAPYIARYAEFLSPTP